MAKRVDFFYDFESPFAYLASTQIEAVAARAGAEVSWRPIFLGGVMQATGNRPPAHVIPKGKYLFRELEIWSGIFDVPLSWPKNFPLGRHLRPIRGALHAFSLGVERGVAYTHAVFRAHWGEHKDITDDDVFKACCEAAEVDFAALSEAITQPSLKEQLKTDTAELVSRGGFGVPTFYVREDGDDVAKAPMFWGIDKIAWLEAVLAGREPSAPSCG